MTKIDNRARQAELERAGKFDVDMNEQHRTFDAMDIDGEYEYLPKKRSEKLRRAVVVSVVRLIGPVVTYFGQGARFYGRKNLRAVQGGAISVCNHVHPLDTLYVKNALGFFRTFHTGSYYLLKRGWAGRIFKAGGFLPVGGNLQDIKNLQAAVGELIRQGKIVNFYPEHALWPRYEKLRPFKPGAFRYAVKFNVPILPLFIEFRQTRLRRLLHRKKKVIVHILPAVYPSAEGTERERSQRLAAAVFEAMRQEGNRLYGRETSARAAVPEELAPQSMSAAPAKDPGKGPAAALFSSAQESEPQPENG